MPIANLRPLCTNYLPGDLPLAGLLQPGRLPRAVESPSSSPRPRVPSFKGFRADVELLEDGASQTVVIAVRGPHWLRWWTMSRSAIARGSVTKMKWVDRVSGAA